MNINEFRITYALPTQLLRKMLLLNFNFSQKSGKKLKIRRLEKSGVFILLKACPTGFFHGKTASPKF
jgi:hypothetical protein